MPKAKRPSESDNIRLVCKDCSAAIHLGPGAHLPTNPLDSGKAARELVSRLYEDILHESCAVFVGAGCTTEGGTSSHSGSFYEEILMKCKYRSKGSAPAFPDLMEYFCEHLDGGRHNRLIREALSRIERFSIPGDDHTFAIMFGEELAEVPYFTRFVTTNWDPFLERSLETLISIVEDRDLGFGMTASDRS